MDDKENVAMAAYSGKSICSLMLMWKLFSISDQLCLWSIFCS